MSMLDSVLGSVKDLGGNAGQGPLMGLVLELVSSNDFGGLPGLVQKFKDNGMGNLIASWIGSGANLPVSPAQIEQVLGVTQIQQLAAKSGIAPPDILNQLAQMLPDVINKLSPSGSLPTGGLLEQGIGLLKGKLLS
jgi:uncharacterized protein YidB (DUF937 family)